MKIHCMGCTRRLKALNRMTSNRRARLHVDSVKIAA